MQTISQIIVDSLREVAKNIEQGTRSRPADTDDFYSYFRELADTIEEKCEKSRVNPILRMDAEELGKLKKRLEEDNKFVEMGVIGEGLSTKECTLELRKEWIKNPAKDQLELLGHYWVLRKSGHVGLCMNLSDGLMLYHTGAERIFFTIDQVDSVLPYEIPVPPREKE